MDEFDRIMHDEPVIQPSQDFARGVMRAVHHESSAPPPLEFPWRRFLPGFFTAVALTLGTFVLIALAGDAGVEYASTARSLLSDATSRGLGIQLVGLLLSLAATGLLVRKATRGGDVSTF